MTKHPLILLLTDFSDEARRAYEPCAQLAERLGGRVELVHVVAERVPPVTPMGPAEPPYVETQEDRKHRIDSAEQGIAQERERLPSSLDTTTAVLVERELARGIASHADEVGADFLAMATHGRSGVSRLLLGSVAESVLRTTSTPLLLFPPSPEG